MANAQCNITTSEVVNNDTKTYHIWKNPWEKTWQQETNDDKVKESERMQEHRAVALMSDEDTPFRVTAYK